MANKKAWVTGNIFQEWFAKCFVPEVKSYLKKKKQPFKALLIIDNAPGDPLIEHPDVNIIFLPPNTTSIIQPMDQGIIATFKMYYLKKNFSVHYGKTGGKS
ncbi:tigger transposable element-derived protein 1-like [Ceratitis capitata]|uniref:tigger transposable element-derived protein 1-like n=1 Tax=Ceratitis capitata TaxID=7213 RepID=UPI000A100BE5|nr:tigger transposable element-derived protein 1-like [Ceratitis capitata]